MIASQMSRNCDVISNRLWRHQQNDRANETFMDSLCCVRHILMYVLSCRTASAPTRVSIMCLFPSLLRNPGNKHKNNLFVSAETVRHSSTYIILYLHVTIRIIMKGCIIHQSSYFIIAIILKLTAWFLIYHRSNVRYFQAKHLKFGKVCRSRPITGNQNVLLHFIGK